MVKINGKLKDCAGCSVAELLVQEGYVEARVAVEKNEEILPRAAYAETILKDGDCVEIVQFMGGG